MRTSRRWTMTAIATAGLAIGSVLAQDQPVQGAGPDQDQANNERYWGIVNNSNNSYKTWPSSLRDSAFDRYAMRHGRTTGSNPAPVVNAPKAEATTATPTTPQTPPAASPTAAAAPTAPVAQR